MFQQALTLTKLVTETLENNSPLQVSRVTVIEIGHAPMKWLVTGLDQQPQA